MGEGAKKEFLSQTLFFPSEKKSLGTRLGSFAPAHTLPAKPVNAAREALSYGLG